MRKKQKRGLEDLKANQDTGQTVKDGVSFLDGAGDAQQRKGQKKGG